LSRLCRAASTFTSSGPILGAGAGDPGHRPHAQIRSAHIPHQLPNRKALLLKKV